MIRLGDGLRMAGKNASATSVPWYDWLLVLAGLAVGMFIVVRYPEMAYRMAVITPTKWLLGAVAIVLVLEGCRRLVGWVLTILVLAFVLYDRFGNLLPGLFQSRGASWERLTMYLYLGTNGMLGLPLVVAATVVLAFVLFGNVLFLSGGATVLTDFAMAAHLFVFYFGILSMITPPVCLATYAAASIAGSDFMKTALTGMRLAAVAYVVPFLFVYLPALLLKGTVFEVVVAVTTAIVGAGLLGIALSGYLFARLNLLKRCLLAVAALAMLTPAAAEGVLFHWITDVAGLAVAVAILFPQWLKSRTVAVDDQAAEKPNQI